MKKRREIQLGAFVLAVGGLGVTGCLLSETDHVPMKFPTPREVRQWREDTKPDAPPSYVVASAVTTETTLPAAAADALSRIGATAVPELMVSLSDPDPQVRTYAARALGMMGDDAKPAVPALTKLLNDQEDNVRRSAAEALGRIGPAAQPAIPDLIRALHAPDVVPVPEVDAPSLY